MTRDPITAAVETNLCTGCGGCAGAFPEFITMVDDATHGRRPVVAPTAAGAAAARAAVSLCAGVGTDWTRLPIKDAIDAAWGPVRKTWEGWASTPQIRHRGSSGGAVTALCDFALRGGTATGVAHIVANPGDARRNDAQISRDRAGVMRGAGSRYAQASPAEALAQIGTTQEQVIFVGKPCDVATVQKARDQRPDLAQRIPLTIAIFCAGAPNGAATERLLRHLDVPKGIAPQDLRYRGEGWPGLMQARWTDSTGETWLSKAVPYAEGWGDILQTGRRWRCRICADHTGAFADISIGDPWHTPPRGDTDPGRSLIVARTARGQAFVDAAIRAGALVAEPRTRDVIAKAQPNLVATHGAAWGRRLAMRSLGLSTPQDRGQALFRLWLGLSAKAKMQSVLGSWKRIWRERLWSPVRMAGPNG